MLNIQDFQNWRSFSSGVSPKVEYTIQITKSIPQMLSFDRRSSLKIDLFQTLTYFLTWWPNPLTCDLSKSQVSLPNEGAHLSEIWWCYVKTSMSGTWSSTQTTKSTNKPSYKVKSNQHDYPPSPTTPVIVIKAAARILTVVNIAKQLYVLIVF